MGLTNLATEREFAKTNFDKITDKFTKGKEQT